MNYLAHAYLSPAEPLVLMGNLWGDLLRPRDYSALPEPMLKGLRLHKAIDAFTDAHLAVDEMMELIRPFQGKYTPVVTDVLMDFMLSTYWQRYHSDPIETFCEGTYMLVRKHLKWMPDHLHPRIQRMLDHEWLESCKNRYRMERTLVMLSRRASFENQIPDALIPYDLHQEKMDRLFEYFFEDLKRHVTLQNEG